MIAQRRAQQRQLGAQLGQQPVEAPLRSAIGARDSFRLAVGPDDEIDRAFRQMQSVAGEHRDLMWAVTTPPVIPAAERSRGMPIAAESGPRRRSLLGTISALTRGRLAGMTGGLS